MRKKLRLIYLLATTAVLALTVIWLFTKFNTYILFSILVGIGLVSIITSLLPYFIAMYLFRQYEKDPENKTAKIWGIILYCCCFPVKLFVIFASIYEMLYEDNHWNFG